MRALTGRSNRLIFALVFFTIGASTLGADKPQVEIVIDRSDIPSVGAIEEHAVRGFVSTMLVCHETCGLDMEAFQKTIAVGAPVGAQYGLLL